MARAVGWVFVALIAYHAVLATTQAVHAGKDGNWSYTIELGAIAIVATLIVVAAVFVALRSHSGTGKAPTP